MAQRTYEQLGEYLWDRIDMDSDDGCWLWLGCVNQSNYGYINNMDKNYRVHRIVYSLLVGEIADGLVIDHLCRNRRCVNPCHLEAVTQKENVQRSLLPFCNHGHPYNEVNTYWWRGTRHCRLCNARRSRETWRKKVITQYQGGREE